MESPTSDRGTRKARARRALPTSLPDAQAVQCQGPQAKQGVGNRCQPRAAFNPQLCPLRKEISPTQSRNTLLRATRLLRAVSAERLGERH